MKIKEAAERCKVRGYIESKILTTRLWKNSVGFDAAVDALPQEYDDWDCFDPEGEETSIVG